jgi:hypothetical protein
MLFRFYEIATSTHCQLMTRKTITHSKLTMANYWWWTKPLHTLICTKNTLQLIGRKPWSFNTHNKNNEHNTNKYFPSLVKDIRSNLNVDFWFLHKKDFIVKPLESWSIVTSRLALENIKCIPISYIEDQLWQLQTNLCSYVVTLHCKRRLIGEECKQKRDLQWWHPMRTKMKLAMSKVSSFSQTDHLNMVSWWCSHNLVMFI